MSDSNNVTLAQLVDLMNHLDDDETFRWFQDSYVASDGSIHAGPTYRVSMGQARADLGVGRRSR